MVVSYSSPAGGEKSATGPGGGLKNSTGPSIMSPSKTITPANAKRSSVLRALSDRPAYWRSAVPAA